MLRMSIDILEEGKNDLGARRSPQYVLVMFEKNWKSDQMVKDCS